MNGGVRMSAAMANDMVIHCLSERPNEACGLLAALDGEIVKIFRMRNAAGSPVRYALDPKEQLAAYRKMDEEGWELGGVFHSHTRTAPFPSPTDVRLAAEDVPYIIVSLAPDPPEIKAFRINKERWTDEIGEITEIPFVVSESAGGRH